MNLISTSRLTSAAFNSRFYTRLAAALFLIVLLALPASAQQQEWPRAQTADLMALRVSTSPAERKLSFNLLLLSRDARHASVSAFASSMNLSSVNPDGTINVEVNAYLSPSLMASPVMADIVRTNGPVPLHAYLTDHLQVRVTGNQLLDLAANPNVLSIREVGSNDASVAVPSTEKSQVNLAAR